jgi:hypothetical protein
MLKKIIPIVLASTIIITSFSFSTQVQAKNSQLKINQKSQKFDKTLQNLNDKDLQKLTSQKLKSFKNNENELISEQSENFQIKMELQNKKIQIKNKQKGDISIGIPNSDSFDSVDVVDNKVIYSGQNSKTDVIIESVDGGFRQVINIKDSSAPDFYDFPVELGIDERLVVNSNGSAGIIRPKTPKELENDQKIKENLSTEKIEKIQIPNYFTKLIIAKPWAKDANGKDLKTSYSIENGNILRQKIDLKEAVFPVVADPTWCGNQISSTNWWQNPDANHWTLSVYPTWCGFNNASTDWYVYYPDAWNGVCNASGTGDWCNLWTSAQYNSMFYQFVCHYNIIGSLKAAIPGSTQGAWNLDEWRPDVGWFETTRNFCNPN